MPLKDAYFAWKASPRIWRNVPPARVWIYRQPLQELTAHGCHRDRLIVALDVDGVARAEALVEASATSASFYKIGYQLVFSGGLSFARDLAASGKRVFLDMKLHDIGNTVAKGTRGDRGARRRPS